MFQFPRCPLLAHHQQCPAARRAGCPIRRPPDPRLPAPPRSISPRGHVLLRPPTPRHPPCARLTEALVRSTPLAPSGVRAVPRRTGSRQQGRSPPGHAPPPPRSHLVFRPSSIRVRRPLPLLGQPLPSPLARFTSGVGAQDRAVPFSVSVSCFVSCAVRAGDQARSPATPRGAPTAACSDAILTEWPRSSPTAAKPGGSRVARCQGAAGHGLGGTRSSPDVAVRTGCTHEVDPQRGPTTWTHNVDPRGGAAGIRTPDLRRARAALSRLSYGPVSPPDQPPPPRGGRAWTRTRDLGLIRAAL